MEVLLKWYPLFIALSIFDVLSQICFKKSAQNNSEETGWNYQKNIFLSKFTWLGITFNVFETALYFVALMALPLTVAYPLTALQKIMIILFSAFVLKEKIKRIEWLAVALIMFGSILVSLSPHGVS
jgi:drug/metabolite transporter (DMT)-like permease